MANDAIEEVISKLEHRKVEIDTTIAILRRELLDENISAPVGGGAQPTHYMAEVTTNAEARERELILECQPSCNQRVG